MIDRKDEQHSLASIPVCTRIFDDKHHNARSTSATELIIHRVDGPSRTPRIAYAKNRQELHLTIRLPQLPGFRKNEYDLQVAITKPRARALMDILKGALK